MKKRDSASCTMYTFLACILVELIRSLRMIEDTAFYYKQGRKKTMQEELRSVNRQPKPTSHQ